MLKCLGRFAEEESLRVIDAERFHDVIDFPRVDKLGDGADTHLLAEGNDRFCDDARVGIIRQILYDRRIDLEEIDITVPPAVEPGTYHVFIGMTNNIRTRSIYLTEVNIL